VIELSIMERAKILVEALPYIKKFKERILVIKCGGKILNSEQVKKNLAIDIVLLWHVGIKPILVHGGGVQVNELLEKLGKKSKFEKGVRKTDEETLSVVEMVLGRINKELVSLINLAGGRAVGLSGKDDNMIQVEKAGEEMGWVGEIKEVKPDLLRLLDEKGFIPVLSPLGVDREGKGYNINADMVAGKIASYLKAVKLIILTDTPGILKDPHDPSSLISSLNVEELKKLVEEGSIVGGMLPKVEASCMALEGGVEKVHIIDGNIPHGILLEVFTDKGVGTEIVS